jgi:glycosyltransferase 2 family protein
LKLVVNLALSLGMLALCLWLVWPDAHTRAQLDLTLSAMSFGEFLPTLLGYLALLAATHFFRAWRWNNLLEPIGARLSPGKLMAISSVGFMAILALPARLGEFVRPALLRDKGKVSGAAVLGTVAVERIVDGLLVSLMVFGFCFSLRSSPHAQPWMMPVAWASLGIFVAAMTFLAFALRWPDLTVRTAVGMTLTPRFAPRFAAKLDEKLRSLIAGFSVLDDKRNLVYFVGWSILYWAANGLGMWLLARGVGLDLSIAGAFATMGLIAVGITLPNSPGLVGQFHYFTTLGLSLYMPKEIAESTGLVYALLLHGIQVIWYVGTGALAMFTGHISFHDMFRKDTPAAAETGGEEAA